MNGWQEITITDIDPERFGQCPVCGQVFTQPKTGRRRIYCSKVCRDKEFRRASSAAKLTDEARLELVKQQMAVGDWRCHILPDWPHYRCLACSRPVGQQHAPGEDIADIAGWYDWNDWDQIRGVYRRVICTTCVKQSGQTVRADK